MSTVSFVFECYVLLTCFCNLKIGVISFMNAVYASATTERTDVLSVKGIRPMFPNPTSLVQASLQHLLVFGNADANFQNILNCMKYIKNIDN